MSGNRSAETKTSYENSFVLQYVKADPSYNCCSTAQSKRLLKNYRNNLMKSQGQGKPLFDDQVIDLLRKYVYDQKGLDATIGYLNNLKDDNGDLFSRNLKIYSSTQDAIYRFAQRDYTSFRWNVNYQKALKDLKDRFSILKLKPISYHNIGDVMKILPKVNTHSGSYWLMTGKKKKGENMEDAWKEFPQLLEEAKRDGTFSYPILLGNRTQASGEFNDDGTQTGKCKHKTRVVSMVALPVIMAELMFSKPFQDHLVKEEFYAGGKDEVQLSKIILDWRASHQKFISIDYSSYDQTISSWLIEDAFDVISSAFIMNDDEKLIYKAIVHDFINKDFIVGEGVVHSERGIPSGSMFTQIIGSLINVIVVSTYFNSIRDLKFKLMAMGDDNIIFCSMRTKMEELASYLAKNFGLIVKTDDKSNEGSTKLDPKFLSRFWTYSGRWRHPNSLISRLAFPERFRDYSGDTKPQHVIMAFILTYDKGMRELMNTVKFYQDYPIIDTEVWARVDSRYLPGSLAYQRDYVGFGAT